jgi:hypothetical protein
MFKVYLILTGVLVLYCLYAFVICLLAIYRENELPDIEDAQVQKTTGV